MIKKARKKPVVIEYIEFEDLKNFWNDDHRENAYLGIETPIERKLMQTENGKSIKYSKEFDRFMISTLEGVMMMTKNDVLIIGVDGELYPCKKDIFEKTYERVEE